MKELLEELDNAYCREYFDYYFKLFNEYVEKSNVIPYDLLFFYIRALIKTRKFDEAYKLTKWIEETNKYPKVDYDIFHFYLSCFKPDDAERIYKKGKINDIEGRYLVMMYLLQGKIDEAKKVLRLVIPKNRNKMYNVLLSKIYNHETYNSFIEIAYDSFIKNGNKLDNGYIVYLKNKPMGSINVDEDVKANIRPYMIWKIEGDKVYLLPITTKCKERDYRLYQQKYRNSDCDRSIKSNPCYTTIDNILSIKDKLTDEDFESAIMRSYHTIYFSRISPIKDTREEFIRTFQKKIELHDIIAIRETSYDDPKFYYVKSIKDMYYEVVEVNRELQLLSNRIELLNKNRIFYKATALSNEEIEIIEKQIADTQLKHDSIGSIIGINGNKYIVLSENDEYCVCISKLYSPSYIQVECFKKSDIKDTFGYITDDEVEEIKDLVNKNTTINMKNVLKRAR